MRKLLLVLIVLALPSSVCSLNLLTYTSRDDDQTYVRFYRVVDDLDVTFKEYTAWEPFGVELNNGDFLRSSGDIATLYVDRQPYASVRVFDNLEFERLDEPVDVVPHEVVQKLQQIEAIMKSGRIVTPETDGVFGLSGNRIFWAGLYTNQLYYPGRTGYLTTKVVAPRFRWPEYPNVVEYSPGRVAYVNYGGTVGFFALDAANKVTVLDRIFSQFRGALKAGNVDETVRLMSWRLPPLGQFSGETELNIDLVLNTRNPGYIVGVLKGLSEHYAIPFEPTVPILTYNPLFPILKNHDNATLRAVLTAFPNLANERDQNMAGNESSFLPFVVCARSGNLDGCRILAEFGASDEARGYPPVSSLTVAPTAAMAAILIELGVDSVLEFEAYGSVNSDGVRIRSDFSTKSSIVGRLNNGQAVRVIGVTAQTFDVTDYPSDRWYRIESESGNGWIFGAFLDLTPMAGT